MIIRKDAPRIFTIESSTKSLTTPFFFPAISSVKTNYTVSEYLQILKKVGYPGFLISSYDIHRDGKRDALIKEISQTTQDSTFTLMDSGNYEAYWHEDKDWKIEKLEGVLKDISVDLCFSFDAFWEVGKDVEKHVKETVTKTAMTAGMQRTGTTIPLIHGLPGNLPEIVRKVVEGVNPEIVGITERELGSSLFERAETLKRIRAALDKTERDIPIHLLGTGNPISLLVYTLCGADLFDALEWCKTVVNPDNGHLYHFILKDLLYCDCKACKAKDVPYPWQTMSHNLIFYRNFMEEISKAVKSGQYSSILEKYIPKKAIPQIKKMAGLE